MRARTGDVVFSCLVLILRWATIAFLLMPFAVMLLMAFDGRPYLGPLPPPSYSLQWFQQFFADSSFMHGLRISLELGILAALASTLLGVAAATALDKVRFAGRDALITLFLSPLAVPPVVTGFALLLFLAKFGVYDGFTRLACGHIIITLPYTIRATLASLGAIDRSLGEAAQSLGASPMRVFWEVTLPLARAGVISGGIFAFAVSMDDIGVSIMLSDSTTVTLPVALIASMRANFSLTIAAASLMLILLTIVLIFVLEKTVGVSRALGQGMFR